VGRDLIHGAQYKNQWPILGTTVTFVFHKKRGISGTASLLLFCQEEFCFIE
jgi:hypothetical protein